MIVGGRVTDDHHKNLRVQPSGPTPEKTSHVETPKNRGQPVKGKVDSKPEVCRLSDHDSQHRNWCQRADPHHHLAIHLELLAMLVSEDWEIGPAAGLRVGCAASDTTSTTNLPGKPTTWVRSTSEEPLTGSVAVLDDPLDQLGTAFGAPGIAAMPFRQRI